MSTIKVTNLSHPSAASPAIVLDAAGDATYAGVHDFSAATVTGLPSSGKVLQVVTSLTGAINVSTTGGYVTTGVTITITPTSLTSKIILGYTGYLAISVTNQTALLNIFRGTVAGTALGPQLAIQGGIRANQTGISFDTPNTLSATTYTVGLASGGGGAIVYAGLGTPFSIYAMEVSA